MTTLPMLYKKATNGKTQICSITYENDTFTVEFGYIDGKKQTKTTTCYPKNVGKANETSGTTQAEAEAKAKWTIKSKRGYRIERPEEVIEGLVLLPMKISKYEDQYKKLDYEAGVYVSPKLDGVHSEFRCSPTTFKLLSRGNEEYPVVSMRDKYIEDIMREYKLTSIVGEFYAEGQFLQDIQSAVKKPGKDKINVDFHAFDLPGIPGGYSDRLKVLEELPVRQVQAYKVKDVEELLEYHNRFLSYGFEGTVIRTYDAPYVYNTRSRYMMKLKPVLDAEFKVVGHMIDKNGHPVFQLESPGGLFKAKPKGTSVQREALLLKANELEGQFATVEYETMSKDNKPLKPIFINVRNCDFSGEPLE